MKRLYEGLHAFKKSHFIEEQEFFRRLSHRQEPEVLFITCSDSRIDPNLVTQSRPGELFIVRNIGNIVPPADSILHNPGAAAALEYAVRVLKVTDIVVCGHSNCGAIRSLLRADGLDGLTHVERWLELISPLREMAIKLFPNLSEVGLQRVIEEENILFQLKNIETYDFVAEALADGSLHLHGWYYDIGAGNVCSYNPESDAFEPIN